MSSDLTRYSNVTGKFSRECILIQGMGCKWKKCSYCDYHLDVSANPAEINRPAIETIKGKTGILEVMNSGSALELDKDTIKMIKEKTEYLNIHTIWFESHWMYRNRLKKFSENFPNSKVYFRTGIETFDPEIRMKWNKGIPKEVTPEDIAKFFRGVNLLVGIKGQTIETIKNDIFIANSLFDYFHINVFSENSTKEKRDENLIKQFMKEIYPMCSKMPKAHTFLNITDLGVG